MKKNKQALSEEEKKELEILDNPDIEYLSPSGGIVSIVFDLFFNSSSKRKEKVVNLRTKMRMSELGIDPSKEWQQYYKIREEEEKRFDERFKNCKKRL